MPFTPSRRLNYYLFGQEPLDRREFEYEHLT